MVAIGGIPQKSPLVMQILSDVLGMPVRVASSFQAVALGASLFAAVASGYYKDIYKAQEKMASGSLKTYNPLKENVETYKRLYKLYIKLGSQVEDILREV